MNCNKCGGEFEPKPWQLKSQNKQCWTCRNDQRRDYWKRRKEEGRPLKGGNAAPEYYRQRLKSPEMKARRAVHNALRYGRMHRLPCERCGNTITEAHHEDYAQPLVVIWLCNTCHADRHAELRRVAAVRAADKSLA